MIASRLGAFAADPAPIEVPGIHNAFLVNEHLISGSQPENDAAFAELARLGVKTIVSVDSAKPDIATARKFGLCYIHLPFGYDGIPSARVAELARAAMASGGAIFVHCHHGKHRGPAAVAVMCEATAGWTPERAEAWLRQAGTADDYPGLYRAAREFRPVSPDVLARLGNLPEVAKTPEIMDTMVSLDEHFELLKTAQKSGWKTPPAEAATLLWEQLREIARAENTAKRPDDYRQNLTDSEQAAEALRTSLRAPSPDSVALDNALKNVGQTCTACHKAYRNEKK